jgi:hypothetical protein
LQPRHHSFVRHEALGPAGMLRGRSRCWGAAVHAACRDSEAANSLRPSAGGANGETAPRARDCHPADRPESLLGNRACFAEPGPSAVVSGFSAHDNSGAHAPSTDSTLGSTTDQRFKASLSSRGRHRSFDLCLPWHPSATTMVDVPRSGTSISSGPALNPALPQGPDSGPAQGARPCATARGGKTSRHRFDSAPRGASRPFLGHSAKMLRTRFYNRRFASRAPMSKHHLWRLPAEPPWETRRG